MKLSHSHGFMNRFVGLAGLLAFLVVLALIVFTPSSWFTHCHEQSGAEYVKVADGIELCMLYREDVLTNPTVFCVINGDGTTDIDVFTLTHVGTRPWQMDGWRVADGRDENQLLPSRILLPGDRLVFKSRSDWWWYLIGLDESTVYGNGNGWMLPATFTTPQGQTVEIGPHCFVPSFPS